MSSTTLEKMAEQVLPGNGWGDGGRERDGREMTQPMYAHVNK
jgi:hypothetical protein